MLVGECDPGGEGLIMATKTVDFWSSSINCSTVRVGKSDPRGEGLVMATAPPCLWARATREMNAAVLVDEVRC